MPFSYKKQHFCQNDFWFVETEFSFASTKILLKMKKQVFTLMLMFMGITAFSQSGYEKIMSEKIAKLGLQNADELTALSNDFIRIGDKEKTQWLPYYYAALLQINKGQTFSNTGKTDDLDAIADAAENLLNKAKELNPENPENYILEKKNSHTPSFGKSSSKVYDRRRIGCRSIGKSRKTRSRKSANYIVESTGFIFHSASIRWK
jgi:hypothetical protein